ncbi:MAG: LuxR C-terminal-related transcriptional regulator [Streptosporangiaceae bacterium]
MLQLAGDLELTVAEIVGQFAGYSPRPRDPADVIEFVGLGGLEQRRAHQLSGGQRRRLDVALGILGRPELRHRPDVVLMDLRMPGGDGVQATAGIIAALPGIRVVVLTTYETDANIVRAVEAGAAGYLLKDTPRQDLVAAIRAAARGETVLGPTVAGRLVSHLRRPAVEPLSGRETEVLALVARGQTNADIGKALFISEATVKTHLLRAFGKLVVSDRTAAVTTAIELGMLPAPGSVR